MICLAVFTDGRRDCIGDTIASLDRNLTGPITRRVIIDDSASASNADWLASMFGDRYEIHHRLRRLGFGGTIRDAWKHILPRAGYIAHWEDDFILTRALDLGDLIAILEHDRTIAQVVLKRQPWNDLEIAAGGIVECWPDHYEDRDEPVAHCTHRLFFSTNPSVYRAQLCRTGWPKGERSEHTFTERLFADRERRCAFYGHRFDPPAVLHIGATRNGTGY